MTRQTRRFAVILGAMTLLAHPGEASIIFGGFTFDDLAFADDAEQLEPGGITLWGGATDLDDAITGFSPDRGIVNLGSVGGNANDFRLVFTDLTAVNGPGADIVFFSARFSFSAWSIAVRPFGESETAFIDFDVNASTDTGQQCLDSGQTCFALVIDLDSYGINPGAPVDSIRFRSLEDLNGNIAGDVAMAAVLNAVPEPSTALLLAMGLSALPLKPGRQ